MLCNCINLNYIGIIKSVFSNHHLVLYILLVIDIITFKFFRSEDDFRKVESSSTVMQSNVFTAYYSQTNYQSPFSTSVIYIIIPKCVCGCVCLWRFYLKTFNGIDLILFATWRHSSSSGFKILTKLL